MEIEQVDPKKPNFLLIVIVFLAALLAFCVLAWVFIRGDSKHLGFSHHHRHPTSQLIQPTNGPAGNDASSTLA